MFNVKTIFRADFMALRKSQCLSDYSGVTDIRHHFRVHIRL